MKIALLGPSNSGKTVYFAALAYKYRNFIGFRPLSESEETFYRKKQVDRRIALQLGFRNMTHEREINGHIALLAAKPIVEWPEKTLELDTSEINSEFLFTDPFDESASIDSYVRSITIFDPPGGALGGLHEDSESVVKSLCSCDVVMAFLPTDLLLEAVDSGDADRVLNGAYFGKMKEIIETCGKRLGSAHELDLLPVCIILSKSDMLQTRPDADIRSAHEMLYKHIVVPFSRRNRNLTLCVCPVSVIDPVSGNFEASNLEWPFLFAAAGTVFRNSLALREDADQARAYAQEEQRRADELSNEGWSWNRFKSWWNDDGVSARRKRAATHLGKFGRLVGEAEDDRKLAKEAWAALGIEGKARQVRIFSDGQELDPELLGGRL